MKEKATETDSKRDILYSHEDNREKRRDKYQMNPTRNKIHVW